MATRKKHTKHAPTLYEFIVLGAMRQSGGEFVDAATIMNLLRRRMQFDIQDSSCHTILHRLEEEGYCFLTQEGNIGRKESRNFYTLTEKGETHLTLWLGRIASMC